MQLRNYDMCIAKNEEAIAIDPRFAECYGNMANAWKVFGYCYFLFLWAFSSYSQTLLDILAGPFILLTNGW